MYGPGEISFDTTNDLLPDDYVNSQTRIADDLEAAQKRVQNARDEASANQVQNVLDISASEVAPAQGLSVDQVQAMIQQALDQQKQAFMDQGLLKLPDSHTSDPVTDPSTDTGKSK